MSSEANTYTNTTTNISTNDSVSALSMVSTKKSIQSDLKDQLKFDPQTSTISPNKIKNQTITFDNFYSYYNNKFNKENTECRNRMVNSGIRNRFSFSKQSPQGHHHHTHHHHHYHNITSCQHQYKKKRSIISFNRESNQNTKELEDYNSNVKSIATNM